ncbi:MAG TPA: hypothetical protein VFR27_02685 [Mycobacterium sp.]|nr:hypothetical protein [Mycobacterium sp.]
MNHYTYRTEWSPEHAAYVGRCIELRFLTHWAPTMPDAIAGVVHAVDEYLAEREAAGDDVPAPLTERQHSGNFVVRTSPALHAPARPPSSRLVISHTASFPTNISCPGRVSVWPEWLA